MTVCWFRYEHGGGLRIPKFEPETDGLIERERRSKRSNHNKQSLAKASFSVQTTTLGLPGNCKVQTFLSGFAELNHGVI